MTDLSPPPDYLCERCNRHVRFNGVLHPCDEREIVWFLSFGISAFDHSTMGPMLDRADRYGHRMVDIDGEGRVKYARVQQRVLPDPRRRQLEHASEPWDQNPITAFITAEHRSAGGYTPNDGTLMLFAKVGRRLQRIGQQSPAALDAVEAHYGDRGAAFDAGGVSRFGSVFRLTEPGKKLLRQLVAEAVKAGNRQDLSDDKRLINELVADRKRRSGHPKSTLITLASRDSSGLLDQAIRLWHSMCVASGSAAAGVAGQAP